MRWLMIIFLLGAVGLAWADEGEEPEVDEEEVAAVEAYEGVILRFNTNTKSFSSWNAFKTAVLSQLPPGVLGNCYVQTSGAMQKVAVTRVKFQPVEGAGWQQTSGNGWRKTGPKRTFVEYRFNQKAGVLLQVEGVKPRFFFAYTTQICEFPLKL